MVWLSFGLACHSNDHMSGEIKRNAVIFNRIEERFADARVN